MKPVTIIINKVEYEQWLPMIWDQVPFKLFIDLDACGQDIIKVISLFTAIEYDTLRTAKIVDMDSVIEDLGFLNKKPEPVIPKTILGYTVPKDLEFEQVQMYLDLKNYVKEAKELPPLVQLERYALYCAVFACIAKHGKYDWSLAEAMAPEFLQAPCTEVLGIGNFTLMKLIGLNLNIKTTSRKAGSRIMRFRLAFRGFMILMVHRLRSLILKKKPI